MATNKKTLVLGASANPSRYSNAAIKRLRAKGHEVVAVGKKKEQVADVEVHDAPVDVTNLHTVTLYLNPHNQQPYIDYILSLEPKRIIFNPGTENAALMKKADAAGIEVVEGCTLVMLSIGAY